MAIDNEKIYNDYIKPELKTIYMSDEYAAQYYYKMGWMAARVQHLTQKRLDEAGASRV
jgi:hypothetical protein